MLPTLLEIPDIQRKKIVVRLEDSHPMVVGTSIHSVIEETWTRLISDNPDLYEAGLVRCVGVTHVESSVLIDIACDITYKHIVGLRNAREFSEILSKGVPFQALSAIAFVYTSDGHLLLIERNTGDWPHSLELPGAFMRPKIQTDGVYQSALDFLKNDLGVIEEQVENYSLMGVLDYPSICEMMLILKFTLTCSSEEIQRQSPKKVSFIPQNYAVQSHSAFFNIPLHAPTKEVLRRCDSR